MCFRFMKSEMAHSLVHGAGSSSVTLCRLSLCTVVIVNKDAVDLNNERDINHVSW